MAFRWLQTTVLSFVPLGASITMANFYVSFIQVISQLWPHHLVPLVYYIRFYSTLLAFSSAFLSICCFAFLLAFLAARGGGGSITINFPANMQRFRQVYGGSGK